MKKICFAMVMLLTAMVVFNAIPVQACGGFVECRCLRAGKRYEVGRVVVKYIPDDTLQVTYDTSYTTWVMTETHLYVGIAPPINIPSGHFPFKRDGLPGVTRVRFTISLDELGADPCATLYIAAHAVVLKGCREETAWTCDGEKIGRGWGTYFSVKIPCA